jgi:hypothetical protein
MSGIIKCSECGRYPQPNSNRPKVMGDKCDYPKCGGTFVAAEDEMFQGLDESPPESSPPPPEQPEMFPKPQFNPRLYTRDQLRDMVEVAIKKVRRASDSYQRAIDNLESLSIMLKTVESSFEQ